MGKAITTSNGGRQGGDPLVMTPGGWRPKSKVHFVEPGHHISGKDGRLQKIQGFLYHLNNTPEYTNPYPPGSDPLNGLPDQTGYETGDTSVTPLNGPNPNYNFAIARVRLQGAARTTSPNTRVFFRLWVAVSTDTDLQPGTTYLSTLGSSGADNGLPIFPLPSGSFTDPSGNALQTIPFFATDATGRKTASIFRFRLCSDGRRAYIDEKMKNPQHLLGVF
jgi:hypothetical protein